MLRGLAKLVVVLLVGAVIGFGIGTGLGAMAVGRSPAPVLSSRPVASNASATSGQDTPAIDLRELADALAHDARDLTGREAGLLRRASTVAATPP